MRSFGQRSRAGGETGSPSPSMNGVAVEALALVAADDGAFVAFTHGEVDRTGSPRDEGNKRWLVALAEDAQHAVSSLDGKILDVGPARLGDVQAVQSEEHGKRGVVVIEALGSEQEVPSLPRSMPWPSLGCAVWLAVRVSASGSDRTRCVTHSSPRPWTPACHCATCKKQPATPTRARRCATTVAANRWTETPPTSSPRSAPAQRPDQTAVRCRAPATAHRRRPGPNGHTLTIRRPGRTSTDSSRRGRCSATGTMCVWSTSSKRIRRRKSLVRARRGTFYSFPVRWASRPGLGR